MTEPFPAGYFDEARADVAQAASAAGKIAGGVFPTPESLKSALSLGYRLVVVSSDVLLLAAGAKTKADTMRDCLRSFKT